MGLTVTVLGCSGTYAAPDNACTGFLVESDAQRVLLDAGPGTLANLQTHIELTSMDAIVLTHEHPDHWLEMPVLGNALKYFFEPMVEMPVHLTAGNNKLLGLLAPGALAPDGPFVPSVIDETSQVTIGDQHWRFSRTDHHVETLAPLVTAQDRSFSFSADTGPGWGFDRFGQSIDLAFVESSLPYREGFEGVQHLAAAEAGAIAAAGGVQRLALSHLPPGSDASHHQREASRAFGKPVEMTHPGATFNV